MTDDKVKLEVGHWYTYTPLKRLHAMVYITEVHGLLTDSIEIQDDEDRYMPNTGIGHSDHYVDTKPTEQHLRRAIMALLDWGNE